MLQGLLLRCTANKCIGIAAWALGTKAGCIIVLWATKAV